MAKKKKLTKAEEREKRSQDWLPIADIKDNIVYKKNGCILVAIRIQPINLELLSNNEKRQKVQALSECFNSETADLQIFCIGRPIDLAQFQEWQEHKIKETVDLKKKQLLKNFYYQTAKLATSGVITERRFYIILSKANDSSKAEQELLTRANELCGKLGRAGLISNVCNETELIEIFSLFAFPAQAAVEEQGYYNAANSTVLES